MNDDKQIDITDFAAILSTTLALAADVDVQVGVRDSPANDRRPAGLLVFLSGLSLDADGRITAAPQEIQT